MRHTLAFLAGLLLLGCGINDWGDASPSDVTLQSYQDVDGEIPPFTGQLGGTYYLAHSGWICGIHPYMTEPPYDETDERVTRVVVHELGETLWDAGDPGQRPLYEVGCYMRDSDATLEGLPPLCPEEAAWAREWAQDHGPKHVHVADAWLLGHAERAIEVWNAGAGITVFAIRE